MQEEVLRFKNIIWFQLLIKFISNIFIFNLIYIYSQQIIIKIYWNIYHGIIVY